MIVPDQIVGVDAHHHFWDLREGSYAWIRNRLHLPNMSRIERDFEEPDFRRVMAANRVCRSLLVQTEKTAIETDQMLARAQHADFVAGVVGWADFEATDVAAEVARRAADPRIKGLRLWALGVPSLDWLFAQPATEAFAVAHERGLTLELFSSAAQLGTIEALLKSLPLPSIVLCHACKPEMGRWPIDGDAFRSWAGGMRRLAGLGTAVKLSGIVTECGDDWRVEDLKPYWQLLLDAFGPDRLIWGSDWPVIERAGGYSKWLNAVRELAADLHADDRQAIFGGNATRIYEL